MDRATPSAALNSSTHPYASTRGSAFDSRRPYISDVSPLSPVLVTMDTKPNCRTFDSLAPAREMASDTDALQFALTDRGLRFGFFHHWRANRLAFFHQLELAMFR